MLKGGGLPNEFFECIQVQAEGFSAFYSCLIRSIWLFSNELLTDENESRLFQC